jgi:hypothetical protein
MDSIMYGNVVRTKINMAPTTPDKSGTSAIQVYVKTYEGMASGRIIGIMSKCAYGSLTKWIPAAIKVPSRTLMRTTATKIIAVVAIISMVLGRSNKSAISPTGFSAARIRR